MKRYLPVFIVIIGIFIGALAYAQNEASEIIFPVAELDNCQNKSECKAYCDQPDNGKRCIEFAKEHGLLPKEEIRRAEQILGTASGPGGCSSKEQCENYCNDISHIDECVAFAEESGLMTGAELEEAKKVQAAVQSGVAFPGGCRNKNECQTYCENPEHADECLAFAQAAGFIPPEELEQARKFLPLMKSGETPGACKSKDECESYCNADEHFEECIAFAERHGLIPKEERAHIEAFRRSGGRGPGGCVGRQCEAYCENPQNQKTCFEWARDNGVLSESDVRRMKEGNKHIERAFAEAPPEIQECLEQAIPGGLGTVRSGEFFGGPEIGEKIESCFQEAFGSFGGPGGPPGEFPGEQGEFLGVPGEFSGGPGGCKSIDECMAYCKNNPEACHGFGPPEEQGRFPQEFQQQFPSGSPDALPSKFQGGPGGCVTGEECQKYCEANPEACQGFRPPGSGPEYQTETQTQYYRGAEECLKQGGQWADGRCFFGSQHPIEQPPIEKGEHVPTPSDEYQQQYQQQYPTSQEDYCKQYPEKCQTPPPEFQEFHEEPQSALPRLFAFVLATFVNLLVR
ncbi:MAG: hypothetical protein Q8O83_00800 [bacterium]|nr:hypothetical protein [bacterium]